MAHPKSADLEALLEALAKHDVKYVVVGGVAAVLHGAPVTTLDLDIVPAQSEDNLHRLHTMLMELGTTFRAHGGTTAPPLTKELLTAGGQLILTTSLGPLDILGTLHSGERYDDLIEDSVEKGDEELRVRIIGLDTLIRIKSSTGRIKDKMVFPLLLALRNQGK